MTSRGWLAALLFTLVPAVALGQTTVEYYHLDALGTVRSITNQSGILIEVRNYLPFGEEWNPSPPQDPRKFTGKERDPETGYDYFGARYYASRTGRFTTTDPAFTLAENLVDPQRWNRYVYVRNNPLRYTDPDGRCIDGCVVEGYAVYVVGAAAVATTMWLVSPSGQQAVGQVVNDTGAMITTAVSGIQSWFNSQATSGGSKNAESHAGPRAADAPGVTAGGQATDRYGNKIGPSGKPQINKTKSTTREGARNRALNEGSGAVEHRTPKQGGPHFHPTDNEGNKVSTSTHHEYPEK